MDRAGTSSSGQSPRPTKRAKRSSIACRRCHSQKIKCSGGTPCSACLTAGKASDCHYPFRERKVTISEHYLKQLQADSDALKYRDAVGHRQVESSEEDDQRLESLALAPAPGPDVEVVNPLFDARQIQPCTQMVTEPPFIGEAACDAFRERLLQSLNKKDVSSLPATPKYIKNGLFGCEASVDYALPDRIHAKLLLQVAKRFIGNGQHLYLNSYMEELESVYQQDAKPSAMWLCKFFVLLALGELYSNRQRRGSIDQVPGENYFATAMSVLQDQYEEATTLHVEVYLLLACYSNALGRIRSAYTHSGVAMRIALSLGMHRSTSSIHISAVERESRRRIWWSLYLFDRLTCSKLGQPVAVEDDVIDVELPTMDGLNAQEKEDFSDPSHLCASVGLARITGDI
ncbi:fungal-specific transcription factor domain-containing protein, partial [Phialemonium atrogriseum]